MPTSRDQTYLTLWVHSSNGKQVTTRVAVRMNTSRNINVNAQQVSPTPKPFGTLFSPSPVERSSSQLQEDVWSFPG